MTKANKIDPSFIAGARSDTHAMAWVVKFTGDALTPSLERI